MKTEEEWGAELLSAWEEWDEHPTFYEEATRFSDVTRDLAAALFIPVPSIELADRMTELRRAGLTKSQVVDLICSMIYA